VLKLGPPEDILLDCMDPPSRQQLDRALDSLQSMGAVDIELLSGGAGGPGEGRVGKIGGGDSNGEKLGDEVHENVHVTVLESTVLAQEAYSKATGRRVLLTALGFHLAKLPLDVRLGKMLIVSCVLNQVEDALTIAAILSANQSVFYTSFYNRNDASREHQRYLKEGRLPSDHLAQVRAYRGWRDEYNRGGRTAAFAYCKEHYLSFNTLYEVNQTRELYRRYLMDANLLRPEGQRGTVGVPPVGAEGGAGGNAEDGGDLARMLLLCALCAGTKRRRDNEVRVWHYVVLLHSAVTLLLHQHLHQLRAVESIYTFSPSSSPPLYFPSSCSSRS